MQSAANSSANPTDAANTKDMQEKRVDETKVGHPANPPPVYADNDDMIQVITPAPTFFAGTFNSAHLLSERESHLTQRQQQPKSQTDGSWRYVHIKNVCVFNV